MTVEDIKRAYIEYLRRRQTPDHDEIPSDVIIRTEDKDKQ